MALVVKNPSASAGDMSLIPGSGRAPWKRTWQPTPVFLPGESPWAEDSPEGHKELYSTEVTACIHSFISHFLKSVKKNTYFQWFFLLFKLMSNNWNYPRIYIFTMFYFIYLPNYPSILGFSLIFFVSMCVCVCVYVCVCVCVWSVAQFCLIICDPMTCLPGSSVHGVFQAGTLEWVGISYSRCSSQPRDWICISCISCFGRRILYHYATCKALQCVGDI